VAEQTVDELARCIDHTLLKPDAVEGEIRALCSEAVRYGFATVCISPVWVRLCSELLRGTNVGVASVAGFPFGTSTTEVKLYEARRARLDGASEIDMVMAVGLLKSGQQGRVREEIAEVARALHAEGALLKLIIETALLSEDQKVAACSLAVEAAADFVKTSTGYACQGATVEDVVLIRRVVGPDIGVKAAGGIRDLTTARLMLAAGATRIGTSSGVSIIRSLSLR
jgi:deoxyribose-phosphate aldolase